MLDHDAAGALDRAGAAIASRPVTSALTATLAALSGAVSDLAGSQTIHIAKRLGSHNWTRTLSDLAQAAEDLERATTGPVVDADGAAVAASSLARLVAQIHRSRALRVARLLGTAAGAFTVSSSGTSMVLERMDALVEVVNILARALVGAGAGGGHRPPPLPDAWYPLSLPRFNDPGISIIIPVRDHWQYTFQCLQSLYVCPTNHAAEIIIVDDGSHDDTAAMLRSMAGVSVVRHEGSLGFGHACNAGAAVARGSLLVFLNNDTTVLPGWLDALVDPLASDGTVGAVGAKLIYPDGRLQEAGGIVWQDGSATNYGMGDRPDRPEYCYLREADYVSAACMAVRKEAFQKVGGFHARYAPAYYEDTDMAFALRAIGLRVIFQPTAEILHWGGVTGEDAAKGRSAMIEDHRKEFIAVWNSALRFQPVPGTPTSVARDRAARHRVLVVDRSVPTWDRDSGSLRLLHLLQLLKQVGCAVALAPADLVRHEPYTHELQRMGIQVAYGPQVASVSDIVSNGAWDVAIVCRAPLAEEYVPVLRRISPRTRVIFDTVDLHHVREQRWAELTKDHGAARQAADTRAREIAVANAVDETWVVSAVEAKVLEEERIRSRVRVVGNIHDVRPLRTEFGARRDVLFLGGFAHAPNVDAMRWFASDIWPLVRTALGDIRAYVVGSDPPEEVRALHGNGVIVTGYVRDLEPLLESVRVSVAPLRYGAGVKGKVTLCMSRGLPVVATPIGAEGLGAQDGTHLVVAKDAAEFAEAIRRVYTDFAMWTKLSRESLALADSAWGVSAARRALVAALGEWDNPTTQSGGRQGAVQFRA